MTHPTSHFAPVYFDRELIAKLDGKGPRYTSYPTADRFLNTFNFDDYQANTTQRQTLNNEMLSLYVHIPFCNTICYYCGCNKIVTGKVDQVDEYLDYLERELNLYAQLFPNRPTLAQLHFGGGTPTLLTPQQFSRIMNVIARVFTLTEHGEYSLEVDPRKLNTNDIKHLKTLGFNRLSLGVQDFNPTVQKAVNRIQSETETREILNAARALGFRSISIDLIYGLPHQTLTSVEETLHKIINLNPDRLAFYNYAHLPHLFMPQRRIQESDLPSPQEKLDILQKAVELLIRNEYVFIGMDHFAKPDDELSLALKNKCLQRNFQGYSTHADHDMIAIGVSSIGKMHHCYVQNEKDIRAYYAALDQNRLPILRGLTLNADDVLRRHVIQKLMCQFELTIAEVEAQFSIHFHDYFAQEYAQLHELEALGLLSMDDKTLRVSPRGRFLIRTIAMVFDRYLREHNNHANYSKTI